ncbi:hypothetical protein [Pararobbsia silviterrae]|uniref:NinB family protein n=1 Tax=Pararobbsia silviterrae TaxID=1792498 RepID=A0A494Y4H3_9BURK|nr:hypothetical protein [Pararobbsia silviterrae]RKP56393.1 hypothetical protein D7S86_08330 [Pararobbsia silviterrae]
MNTLSKTFVLRNDTNAHSLWDLLKAHWRDMAAAGKPLAVTVSEHKAKRTSAQHKRYFALVQAISEQAWIKPEGSDIARQFDVDIWHEHLKDLFAPREEGPGGRLVAMSTTRMSVEEHSRFTQDIEVYAVTELKVEFAYL